MFGEPPGTEATYDVWLDHVHPDDRDRVRRTVRRSIQQRNDFECEYRVVWPDGSVHWLASVARPIFGDDGDVARLDGFMREISQAKEAELLAARRERELGELHHTLALRAVEAETASRAKEAFLGNISHEFRTPLNHILGGVEVLRSQPHAPEQDQWLELIANSGAHLLQIVEDLLELTASAGAISPRSRTFAPRAMMQEVIASSARRARQARIALHLDLDWSLPDRVVGDPGLIARALANYVGNALRFPPAGSMVTVRARVERAATDVLEVRFEVADEGPGVPKEVVGCVFDDTAIIDSALHRRVGGLGLGLASTRKIVAALGGEVGYESIEGAGSRFWFVVPLKRTG
jgi:signal transduction histidine kinase